MKRWPAILLVLLSPASFPEAASAEPERIEARRERSADWFAGHARQLLEDGRSAEAIALLKEGVAAHPDSGPLAVLLARSYQADHNEAWANRSLAVYLQRRPDDCLAASWLAWLQLKQGALEEARDLLAEECPGAAPLETRRQLLLSMVASHSGDPEAARAHLAVARKFDAAFPEDREALARLGSREPGFVPPLSLRLDVQAGGTSNVQAGSPVDPAAASGDEASAAGQLAAWARFVAPTGTWLRPALEVDGRALGYGAQAGRDLSYLLLGGRPGVLLGAQPNVLLAYRYEGLLLAGGDRYGPGPLWFYEAHRAELEASLLPSLTLFVGAGRRLFRETGRSRTEVDGGVGGGVALSEVVSLMGALTGRWHGARKAPYDLWGGSLLLSAELRLPKRWSLRAAGVVGLDSYRDSRGYFEAAAPQTARRDVLLKLSASGFSPPLAEGLRVGLAYEYSERFSTTAPYDYRDHRLLAKLQWTLVYDPWLPTAVADARHVPLDYGLASAALEDRIQDLLRQDEAAQRSSSCVK